MQQVRIAIIGDFNFTYNTHHATNLALDHAARFLEVDLSYYWIRLNEVLQLKPSHFNDYDGIWVAPGPFINAFYLQGIVDNLLNYNVPVLVTGEGFKSLLESLIVKNNLNKHGEKLVSDNLVEGNHFERLFLEPVSRSINQLYSSRSNEELTATRYSMYPQLIQALTEVELDIEAMNQFEEPEIISLKNHRFFLACGFCPQISSTRDIPHPLIYTFIKACLLVDELVNPIN